MDNVKEIRYNSYDMMAPVIKLLAEHAINEANDLGYSVRPFETYRTPNRQDFLYSQGRSIPGKIVTNARGWQSFHQYGSALDVVFFINGRWCWDDNLPWDKVANIFSKYHFTGLKFEKPHFEMTAGMTWQQAYNLVRKDGVPAFHEKLQEYYVLL